MQAGMYKPACARVGDLAVDGDSRSVNAKARVITVKVEVALHEAEPEVETVTQHAPVVHT